MAESKRFEDWEEVDCNDCARYWDSSCDGVNTSLKGSGRLCSTFIPTRSILIPEEIKRLKRAFKWLLWALLILGVLVVGITVVLVLIVFGG
jgi:hypothetical protein